MSAALAAAPSPPAIHASTPAHGGHATAAFTHGFKVARPVAESFRFFEPVGEKRWASDWQPVFAGADDAQLKSGSTFTVERPGYGPGTLLTVWTILRYEPPALIEYLNTIPGIRTTRITVRCAPAGAHDTQVSVDYLYRSISVAGDASLAGFTVEKYRMMIDSWGKEIADYLQRGTPASP